MIEVNFKYNDPCNAKVEFSAPTRDQYMAVVNFVHANMSFYDQAKAYEAKKMKMPHVDCWVRFFDKDTGLLPIGLIARVAKSLKKRFPGCKVKLDDDLNDMFIPPKGEITRADIVGYVSTLHIHNTRDDEDITPYEHQYKLAETALNRRRCSLLACTSAGKSLSMMIIARYLVDRENRKVLIIVPSTNLVEQLYSDFHDDYGWEDARRYCTLIHGSSSDKLSKKDKERLAALNLNENHMLKDITISTWQSLQKKDPDFFKCFSAVIVDEAHGTKGTCLRKILGYCVNANDFKIGVSGTLPDEGLDAGFIESAIGQKIEIVRLKKLVADGILTPVAVNAIFIPYPNQLRTKICEQNIESEYSIVTNNSSRKDVVDMLINAGKITTEENTVILFKSIANLEIMLEFLKEKHPEFNYHVIKGDVDTEERESIRKSIEYSVGNIIIATYGCMKQGVNIKLLHTLVMADPAKSQYMVVQSIGRIVRPHKNKKLAKVFDFVDDASYMTRPMGGHEPHLRTNGMMKHYFERQKYYEADAIPINEIHLDGMYTAPITTDELAKKREKAAAAGVKAKKPNPYKKRFFV